MVDKARARLPAEAIPTHFPANSPDSRHGPGLMLELVIPVACGALSTKNGLERQQAPPSQPTGVGAQFSIVREVLTSGSILGTGLVPQWPWGEERGFLERAPQS